MSTASVEDASIAMCENAKALNEVHVWMKGIDRSLYKINVFYAFHNLF